MLIPEFCRNMLIKYHPALSTNRNVNGFNNSVVKGCQKGITRIGNRNVNHPKWCIPSIMTLACQSRKGTDTKCSIRESRMSVSLLRYIYNCKYLYLYIINHIYIYMYIFFLKLTSWSSFSTKNTCFIICFPKSAPTKKPNTLGKLTSGT